MQYITYTTQHIAYTIQHITYTIQHITYTIQQIIIPTDTLSVNSKHILNINNKS